ncbi:MAG: hypothetical protein JNK82_37690 [Myxococcaceae bacterium]|nr:hypothetical protein [Myxococcaceae bacterium]
MLPLLLALATAASPAPRAWLSFWSEAPTCTEGALREAVAWRLDGDPFGEVGPLGVEVKVVGADVLIATVTLFRQNGPHAARTFTGPLDCRELLGSIAAALEPELKATAALPAVATAAPPRFTVTGAAGADLGQQPDGLVSARIGVRAGGALLTGLVEGVFTLPSRLWFDDGSFVSASFFGATLGACLGKAWFHGCAIVRGGALRLHPLDQPALWAPSFSGGLRGAVEWPKGTTVALYAALEVRVPFGRLSLYESQELWWQQNWLTGALQAGLVVRVP